MRSFRVNHELEAVCEWQNTRNGFRHLATLLRNGTEIAKAKAVYCNRTWERYEYESVLQSLANKAKDRLDLQEQELFSKRIKADFR